MTQQDKDPALLLLWCRLDSWSGNFHMLWPKKKKRRRNGGDEVVRKRKRDRRAGVLEAKGRECFKKKRASDTPHASDSSREVFLPAKLSNFYLYTYMYVYTLLI